MAQPLDADNNEGESHCHAIRHGVGPLEKAVQADEVDIEVDNGELQSSKSVQMGCHSIECVKEEQQGCGDEGRTNFERSSM